MDSEIRGRSGATRPALEFLINGCGFRVIWRSVEAMKWGLRVLVLLGAVMAPLLLPAGAPNAASLKFGTCAQMNERFPTGLSQSARAASRVQAAEYQRPQVNASLFRQVRQLSPRLPVTLGGVLCPIRVVVQPPGSVSDLRIRSVARDSLVIEWRPPAVTGGARIAAYVVEGPGDIAVSGTTASVSNLLPGTAYEYQVSAVNSAGAGQSSIVDAVTLPPPMLFQIPPLWEEIEYSWASPGSHYLNYSGTVGTVLSLSNAPQLFGRVRGTLCSGSWNELAAARIEFLDSNGSPVSRNAVVNGRPDLTRPDPYSPFGPSQELVGYFPGSSDFSRSGCASTSIELTEWQRAKQIRVVTLIQRSNRVLLGLDARDEK